MGLSKPVDLAKDVVGYGDSPIDRQLCVGHIEDEIDRTRNSIAIQTVRQRYKDILVELDTVSRFCSIHMLRFRGKIG